MAEVEHKIRITTEFNDEASHGIKKAEAQVLSFATAAQKAGRDVSKAFDQQEKAAKGSASTLGGLFDKLKDLKTGYIGVAAASAGLTSILIKAIGAASSYEQTVKRLTTSLGLVGITSKTIVGSLLQQAEAIQKTTVYSDDAVISVQALLTTLGTSPRMLKTATQAVVDFASATNRSLEESAEIIGRTLSGQIPRGLGALTDRFRALSDEQLKAGEGIRIFQEAFAGSAQENVNTFSGAIAQVKNSMGDFLKTVGQFILQNPAFLAAVNALSVSLKGLLDTAKDALAALSPKGITGRTFIPDSSYYRGMPLSGPAGISAPYSDNAGEMELRAAEKRLAHEREITRLKEKQKELTPKLDELEKQLRKEVDSARESAQREFNERKKLIDELYQYRVVKTDKLHKELLDLNQVALQKEFKQIKENEDKKQLEFLESFKKAEQYAVSAGSAIGAGIGLLVTKTPQGAAAGAQLGQLLESIQTTGPDIANKIGLAIGETFTRGIENVVDIVGNFGKGITAGFQKSVDFIKSIGNLFSSPDYFSSLGEAIAAAFDNAEFTRLLKDISSNVKSTADSFRSIQDRIQSANRNLQDVRGDRNAAFSDLLGQVGFEQNIFRQWRAGAFSPNTPGQLFGGGYGPQQGFSGTALQAAQSGVSLQDGVFRIIDAERFKKALDSLGESLKKQASAIIEITNLRLQGLEEERSRIASAVTGIANIRQTVSGALLTPMETVAQLQARFSGATGGERAEIGLKLAGALQTQFEAARNLAAQGAITGEELKNIQDDILRQLGTTEAVAKTDAEIMQTKIDELKAEAVKQVDKLSEILDAIKDNNIQKLVDLFKNLPHFQHGTSHVSRTGFAMVHEGEAIIPRNQNQGPGAIVINIDGARAMGGTKEELTKAVREILIQNMGNFRGAIQRASR